MKKFKYQHIVTENYLKLEAAVREAMEFKLFLLVFGDSGYGKSFTYSDLAKKSDNSIVHLEIEKTDRPVELYNKVISTFPAYDNYRSTSIRWTIEKAADLYNEKRSPSVLIIDEANQFKPNMLGFIRQFRDKTEYSTGLIISGPEEFHQELIDWKDARVKGINEFWTRKDDVITIDPPSCEDLKNICIANSIEDIGIINDLIDASEGNYRGLRKQIEKYYRNLGYQIVQEAA